MDEETDIKKPLLTPTLPRWWRVLPTMIFLMIITTIDSLILNDFIEYRYRSFYQVNSSSVENSRELCLNATKISHNVSHSVSTTTSIYPQSTTISWNNLIQQSTAHLNVLISVAATVSSIFTSIILGSNCDEIGRKPLVSLPFIGKIIRYLILTAVAYFNLSNIWIILSVTLDGLFGTAALNILSSFAFVTDCTTEKTRTAAIIITDVCIGCSKFIPLLTMGIYLEQPKFTQSMIFTLFLSLVGFIFCIVLQPESNLNVQHLNMFQQLKKTKLRAVTNIYRVFFVKREDHKQRTLLMLVSIHLCIIFMQLGHSAMYYIYLYGTPFCLDSFGVSLNSIAQTTATVLFTIPFTLTIAKRTDHLIIPALGCLAMMGQLSLFGIAKQVWMLYLAVGIGSLCSVLTPVIRSRITKTVEPSEYAVVFILANISESAGYYAISALGNEIYEISLTYFPGLVFFVFAGIGVISILLILILYLLEYRPTPIERKLSING